MIDLDVEIEELEAKIAPLVTGVVTDHGADAGFMD